MHGYTFVSVVHIIYSIYIAWAWYFSIDQVTNIRFLRVRLLHLCYLLCTGADVCTISTSTVISVVILACLCSSQSISSVHFCCSLYTIRSITQLWWSRRCQHSTTTITRRQPSDWVLSLYIGPTSLIERVSILRESRREHEEIRNVQRRWCPGRGPALFFMEARWPGHGNHRGVHDVVCGYGQLRVGTGRYRLSLAGENASVRHHSWPRVRRRFLDYITPSL